MTTYTYGISGTAAEEMDENGKTYGSFEARVDGVYANGRDAWTVKLDGTTGTASLCVTDPPDMRATYRVTVEKVDG